MTLSSAPSRENPPYISKMTLFTMLSLHLIWWILQLSWLQILYFYSRHWNSEIIRELFEVPGHPVWDIQLLVTGRFNAFLTCLGILQKSGWMCRCSTCSWSVRVKLGSCDVVFEVGGFSTSRLHSVPFFFKKKRQKKKIIRRWLWQVHLFSLPRVVMLSE